MYPTSLSNNTSGFFPFDKKHFIVFSIFSILYLSWTNFVMGFRSDHLSFYVFIFLMFFLHRWTRSVVYGFIFFIAFWVIYDSMRVYPNYLVNDVRVIEPYLIELNLFGIFEGTKEITPNEYLKLHSNSFLDIISGIFYLTWVPIPIGLGIYLFFKDKPMMLRFSAAYLFANLLGFCIYYLYPAAPPWYFEKYGDVEKFNIPGDPAQLVRFDSLIGYPLFTEMYSKNSNVFAAIPSLHSAYPVISWYYARKKGLKIGSVIIFIDIIGIWFAAVYSYHHYFIDVLLGLGCAIGALLIFEGWLYKTQFSRYLNRYVKYADS
jgi:membrane-associated phospholipid phosphatase